MRTAEEDVAEPLSSRRSVRLW